MARRIAVVGAVLSVVCLALVGSSALADSSPPTTTSPFAKFAACMKEHGAPALTHRSGLRHLWKKGERPKTGSEPTTKTHQPISAADLAALKAKLEAWKTAFTACRDQLPKPKVGDKPKTGDQTRRPGFHFAMPTAAQIAAFKTCMADKGFSVKAGSARPDLGDPAVRGTLMAALKTCLPQLKPASTG